MKKLFLGGIAKPTPAFFLIAILILAVQQLPATAAEAGLQKSQPPSKLFGFVRWNNQKFAALQLRGGAFLFAEGARDFSYELLSIDEQTATVRIRNGQTEETLQLAMKPGETLEKCAVYLEGAPQRIISEVYQTISGRTVLASSRLPAVSIDFKTDAALSAGETLKLVEEMLAKNGLAAIPRGENFVFITTKEQAESIQAYPGPPSSVAQQDNFGGEVFPAGLVRFGDAEILQVLDLYQELTGRTVLRPNNLPAAKISVRTQTSLTRAEATWMLEARVYLENFKVVDEGEKFTYVVPANARYSLPQFDANTFAKRIGKGVNTNEVISTGSANFINAEPQQLLNLYAGISGRKTLPLEKALPLFKCSLRSQKGMTRVESLFALEALAAINGLQFQMVGDNEVTLVPRSANP
jgi:hypothetical protein